MWMFFASHFPSFMCSWRRKFTKCRHCEWVHFIQYPNHAMYCSTENGDGKEKLSNSEAMSFFCCMFKAFSMSITMVEMEFYKKNILCCAWTKASGFLSKPYKGNRISLICWFHCVQIQWKFHLTTIWLALIQLRFQKFWVNILRQNWKQYKWGHTHTHIQPQT